MNKSRKRINLKEAGITLIALVVTIIVLLILAGVTISIVLGNNGILNRAQEASNTYANATKNETRAMAELNNGINEMLEYAGTEAGSILEWGEEAIAAVNAKTTLQTIAYTPKATATVVRIPSDNNGWTTAQSITQTSLGASSLNWYVLSADENGINLVSDATSKDNQITFKGFGGYDNCLYYLNEIATKLFTNEESYGADASRVHALRLSDIEYATKQMNGSSYNWETTFENGAISKDDTFKQSVSPSDTNYPKIYGTRTGAVNINNPMKDEDPSESGVPIASDTSTKASSLTVNKTYYSYYNSSDTSAGRTTMLTNLGTFGSSGVAGKLFDESGGCWLATRCVSAGSRFAYFYLRYMTSGCLDCRSLCGSNGDSGGSGSRAVRVVVSIPASHVDIASDGTVTLK